MRRWSFVFGILFVAAGMFVWWFIPRAFFLTGKNTGPLRAFTVEPGWDMAKTAEELEKQGIVKSAWGYRLYSLIDPTAEFPRAGTYHVPAPANYRFVARMLSRGPARDEITFTVIEGWTITDLIQALNKIGVDARPSDFLADRFASEYPFLKDLPSGTTLEGYLFPETYRVWKDQLPEGLIRKQLDEFAARAPFSDPSSSELSFHDVVALASMVESEVRRDEDRPIVAGIFLNRLRHGMRLQSDATLNYVLRSGRTSLTSADLENPSPYNTYTHAGLPPGPISNPGQASIQAALHPASTDFLYFLTDDKGKTYFAKTLEEHNQNRRRVLSQ